MRETAFVTNKFAEFKENLTPDASAQVRTSSAFDEHVNLIRVITDSPVFYKLGGSSVSASATDSVKMLAGGEIIMTNGEKYISFIAETGTAKVNVSEFR